MEALYFVFGKLFFIEDWFFVWLESCECRVKKREKNAYVPSFWEKNLLQPGCKPGCLQPLTKRWIGPTCRSIR
jgi:hypothetical protein